MAASAIPFRPWARRMLTPTVEALLALICLLAVVGLGLLAKTAFVTRHDLRVDVRAEALRSPHGTQLALALTDAASEVVGIGVLLLAVVVLVLRRRRWDAARLVAAAGTAWVLGIVLKSLIGRTRPPATLELLKPDSAASFPSGHDTTACITILVALVVLRGLPRARLVVTALAVVFAAAVGASRVYLGDHYPTDVLGSWLTVATAALLVRAFTDLRPVRRAATRLLRDPAPEPIGARS
ncbi:phosphatase PAP2 family protein [Amnibacterium sp. CER49]|uniref:phosphatase PAP2 family protein n=1 Tax=Amnibacterium sp. CER49 TaxID=3039161 RepID=UPI002447B855|nr:phosphatase PAP2 family protein [Amnibacterium sp. CER49]MDH2444172.1 phosphatase PAP2 family protein [Amnibacterium sp. CER49]